MSISDFVIFVEALSAGLLPVGLVFHVTNYQHSKFRNALWELRDELTDDLLLGHLKWSPPAETLLRLVETYIRFAPRHSFVDVQLAIRALEDQDVPDPVDEILGTQVDPPGRQRMANYLGRLVAACTHHMYAGSPSGWIAWAWLALRSIGSRILHPRAAQEKMSLPELTEQALQFELVEIPRLMPLRKKQNPDPQPGPLLTEWVGVGRC